MTAAHFHSLAPNQEGILFAHQAAMHPFDYNEPMLYRFPVAPDPVAIQGGLDQIAALGSCLGARLCQVDGGPALAPGEALALHQHTVAGPPESPVARTLRATLCQHPFDMARGPLLRVHLMAYADGTADLLLLAHHLAVDEVTMDLLARALISGEVEGLQAYDHTAWAADWWARVRTSRDRLAEGRAALAEGTVDVPLAWGCATETVKGLSRRYTARVDADRWQAALKALQRRTRASAHSVVMSALGLVVARNAHIRAPVIATAVSQRTQACARALGYFTGTALVVLPPGDTDESVAAYVGRTHRACVAAYRRSDLPLVDLLEGVPRQGGVQVCLVPRTTPARYPYTDQGGRPREAVQVAIPHFGMNQFPINAYWSQTEAGDLEIDIYHCPSALHPEVMPVFERQLRSVLERFGTDPDASVGRLDTLDADLRTAMVRHGQGEPLASSPDTLVTRLATMAARQPQAVAVQGPDATYTYGMLWDQSGRLATALRTRGIGPGAIVGVLMERSAGLVLGLVGLLRAGAAYLPLDAHSPPDRRAFMLADAGAVAVLTDQARETDPNSPDAGRDRAPPTISLAEALADPVDVAGSALPAIDPEAPAYIIYTSGSTGTPKGVLVRHRNVVALLDATARVMTLSPTDVWSFFHSVAFDFSVWEIFGCLASGGRLVVVPHLATRSPDDFHALLVRDRVTVLNQTPSAFSQVLLADATGSGRLAVTHLIFGGEPLDSRALTDWFARYPDDTCAVINMYGITETTVHCTARRLTRVDAERGTRSVGRPLPGWRILVLDDAQRVLPPGVDGELYVGGAGVAAGYLNRPELTHARFVPDPVVPGEGGPVYRSGDRGRFLPNGELEHLGRLDDQVKLRGFRIELGEIRAALLREPGIKAAAVVLDRADGDPARASLRAFVVAAPPPDAAAVKRQLRRTLPEYMVPATLHTVAALPLTRNGKLDAAALLQSLDPSDGSASVPAAAARPGATAESAADPSAKTLPIVCRAWEEVLGITPGASDNFFDLGGNSMLAARLRATLEREGFGALRLRHVLANPTPRAMARLLETGGPGA